MQKAASYILFNSTQKGYNFHSPDFTGLSGDIFKRTKHNIKFNMWWTVEKLCVMFVMGNKL